MIVNIRETWSCKIYSFYLILLLNKYCSELPQDHCGDNREGTLFSWLHMNYAHLAFVRFEHSVCRGSLMTTYIYIYIYIYLIHTKICHFFSVLVNEKRGGRSWKSVILEGHGFKKVPFYTTIFFEWPQILERSSFLNF